MMQISTRIWAVWSALTMADTRCDLDGAFPVQRMNPSAIFGTPATPNAVPAPIRPAFRSPRRVTITLPFATYQDLQERADDEGRSLSNLAAFLLELALHDNNETNPASPESRPVKQTLR